MPNDDFQYIKLPDGSYGKFRADVSDDVIRTQLMKDFPDAFKEPGYFGQGLSPGIDALHSISTGLGNLANRALGKANQAEVANLSDVAHGKPGMPIPAYAPSAGYDLLGRTAGLASSAFEPKSAALMAGIIAANTNPWTGVPVDVALVAHGGYGMAKSAPAAFGGNPDAMQNFLLSSSEAAGGGAGLNAFSPKINAARTTLAQKTVEPLVYENLGETGADVRMGISPERGIVREGLTGTRVQLLEKASARTGELKQAANNVLRTGPKASQSIDVESIIDQAIDKAVANQNKVAGDTTRLENLRAALKKEYGPTNGTPYEINNLKTSIQEAANNVGAYKNTSPIEGSLADAMREVARGIKDKVNEAFPDAASLNERMADLIDARGGLQKGINASKGRSIFGGFHEGMGTTLANRTIGSAPVRSVAARALSLGLAEDVPKTTSPFQPPRNVAPLVQGNATPFTGSGPTPMTTPYQAPVGNLPPLGFPAQPNLWSGMGDVAPRPQWETPTRITMESGGNAYSPAPSLQGNSSPFAPPEQGPAVYESELEQRIRGAGGINPILRSIRRNFEKRQGP